MITPRQNLIREQGLLELLLKLTYKLLPIVEAQEQQSIALSTDSSFLHRMTHNILQEIFTILYYAMIDNPVNQMYVADFLYILLSNLNSQPLAVQCVTEMLSKNMELQETKIGT